MMWGKSLSIWALGGLLCLASSAALAAKLGEPCSNDSQCDSGLQCYPTAKGNVCTHICDAAGFPPGSPGSLCTVGRTCKYGANCVRISRSGQVLGYICLQRCTSSSICSQSNGGSCTGFSKYRGLIGCVCTSNSQCKNGKACNKTDLNPQGQCADQLSGKPCSSGFECKSITFGPKICHPRELCGDGKCEASKGEDCSTCAKDCACKNTEYCDKGSCKDYCGDSKCEAGRGENCKSCAADCACKATQYCEDSRCKEYCGDGKCEASKSEDCSTCAADCKCPADKVCDKGACKTPPPACGNGTCQADKNENCETCPKDCSCTSTQTCVSGKCENICGNGTCQPPLGENCASCPQDCTCAEQTVCRGGICLPETNCGNKMCEESNSETCSNCPQDCPCPAGHSCQSGKCIGPEPTPRPEPPPGQEPLPDVATFPLPELGPEPTKDPSPPQDQASPQDKSGVPGSYLQPCIAGKLCNTGLRCTTIQGGRKTVCVVDKGGCDCNSGPTPPSLLALLLLLACVRWTHTSAS